MDDCPDGWYESEGECLKLSGADRRTWADAQASCIEQGAKLAKIGSQERNDWIADNISVEDNKHLAWFDGSDLTWSNMGPNEDNEFTECAGIVGTKSKAKFWRGKWADRSCARVEEYVCAKKPQGQLE